MSLLKLNIPRHTSPPDRFRFTCPDGFVVIADEKELWLRKIKDHYALNDMTLPDNWQALAEDQLCRVLPPGLCRYEDGANPDTYINTRMTQGDWKRGMTVLGEVVTGDDPLVDQATAEARARICAACPANIVLKGCSACVGMADFIAKIRGAAKTESDKLLAQCGICHCSNRAQVWVKAELLAKGVSPEMMQQFESVSGWCWKAQELKQLQTQP